MTDVCAAIDCIVDDPSRLTEYVLAGADGYSELRCGQHDPRQEPNSGVHWKPVGRAFDA